MIGSLSKWFRRQSLVSKGMRCDRSRRRVSSDEFQEFLEHSRFIRGVIILLSAIATIRIGMWQSQLPIHEALILTTLLFGVALLAFPLIIREVWRSNNLLTLTMVCFIANLLLNKTLFVLLDSPNLSQYQVTDLLAPSALGPILITILISPAAGLFLVLLLSLASNIFLGSNVDVLISGLITGLAGVMFARNIRRRSNLLMAGAAVGLVGMVCSLFLSGLAGESIQTIALKGVWSVILGIVTVFVVGAILPILEWAFDRITDISWLELTDLNHPLLKKLTLVAPGTYHHSLMVGNLAESAAEAIGANSTMCRVLAYFHDIGKMNKPEYFIENISPDSNPHNSISPTMSALIIISHVKEGVDLALKYGLPYPIIDAIKEHHGTSMVYFFYRKALRQQEDARLGSEILGQSKKESEVQQSSFRYPGPIPQFRESAIVSLADAIESSSRTLRNPTAQTVKNLVKEIIQNRINDGQLDDSGLTLDEIHKIGDRFTFTLSNMLHARIEYPKEKKPSQPSQQNPPQTVETHSAKSGSSLNEGTERAVAPSQPSPSQQNPPQDAEGAETQSTENTPSAQDTERVAAPSSDEAQDHQSSKSSQASTPAHQETN